MALLLVALAAGVLGYGFAAVGAGRLERALACAVVGAGALCVADTLAGRDTLVLFLLVVLAAAAVWPLLRR